MAGSVSSFTRIGRRTHERNGPRRSFEQVGQALLRSYGKDPEIACRTDDRALARPGVALCTIYDITRDPTYLAPRQLLRPSRVLPPPALQNRPPPNPYQTTLGTPPGGSPKLRKSHFGGWLDHTFLSKVPAAFRHRSDRLATVRSSPCGHLPTA